MNITEKDIYKFVFYKSELSQEKQNFISINLDKFAASIELLNEIKLNTENEVSSVTIKKITDLIEQDQPNKEIILTPIDFKNCSDYLTLAADSKSYDGNNTTQTFTDNGNNYIAKIVKGDNETKLFLFANTSIENSEISFVIHPSNEKYSLENNKSNCIVLKKQNIEKIIIH